MMQTLLACLLVSSALLCSLGFRPAAIQCVRGAVRSQKRLSMVTPTIFSSMPLAELDADTLGALGDVGYVDVSGVVEGASQGNVAMSVLMKITGSPLILVVPIGAGVLVAVLLGWFISSYSNGKEPA